MPLLDNRDRFDRVKDNTIIVSGLAIILAVIAFMLVALFYFYPTPKASALEQPVRVPAACRGLAQKNGIPLTLKTDADTDKARTAAERVDFNDPTVQRCLAAILKEQEKRK